MSGGLGNRAHNYQIYGMRCHPASLAPSTFIPTSQAVPDLNKTHDRRQRHTQKISSKPSTLLAVTSRTPQKSSSVWVVRSGRSERPLFSRGSRVWWSLSLHCVLQRIRTAHLHMCLRHTPRGLAEMINSLLAVAPTTSQKLNSAWMILSGGSDRRSSLESRRDLELTHTLESADQSYKCSYVSLRVSP